LSVKGWHKDGPASLHKAAHGFIRDIDKHIHLTVLSFRLQDNFCIVLGQP